MQILIVFSYYSHIVQIFTINCMQILLVEDEYRLAENIAKFLRLEAFNVDISREGNDAIAKLANSYDLIILDRMLPGKNGIEILVEIRKIYPTVPVIFLSAL